MGIFDSFREKRKEKKELREYQQQFNADKQTMIEKYQEYEKQGFYVDRQDNDTKTTTLFKDGALIVCDTRKALNGKDVFFYDILTKDKNGEFVLKKVREVEKWEYGMHYFYTELQVNEFDSKKGAYVFVDTDKQKYTDKEVDIIGILSSYNKTIREYDATKKFFDKLINDVEDKKLKVQIQAKCVCVDARKATPEEVGTKFTVWSHGKVEKTITVKEDTVFLTTLDKNGKPVVDEEGHENTYDMPLKKFTKKYQKHPNGHFVQDPTPMATIKLPDDMIPEKGLTLLPPCWGGYEGTLMRGGLVMLPFNPNLTGKQQIEEWKQYMTGKDVDWYPNNEPDTYAVCDKHGLFKDEELRALYGQKSAQNQEERISD